MVGSFKCNKAQWFVCVNVTKTNTFTSTVNVNIKWITSLTVTKVSPVYRLMCKRCGIQVVGQTFADFRYWRNNYKDNRRKPSSNKDMYDHYLSCNKDFFKYVLSNIDKTDPFNPLVREQYWRCMLQTNASHDLNIADGVSLSLFNDLHFHGIDF